MLCQVSIYSKIRRVPGVLKKFYHYQLSNRSNVTVSLLGTHVLIFVLAAFAGLSWASASTSSGMVYRDSACNQSLTPQGGLTEALSPSSQWIKTEVGTVVSTYMAENRSFSELLANFVRSPFPLREERLGFLQQRYLPDKMDLFSRYVLFFDMSRIYEQVYAGLWTDLGGRVGMSRAVVSEGGDLAGEAEDITFLAREHILRSFGDQSELSLDLKMGLVFDAIAAVLDAEFYGWPMAPAMVVRRPNPREIDLINQALIREFDRLWGARTAGP